VLATLIFTGKIDLHSEDWRNKLRCKAKELALNEEISDIIINSYRDSDNHNTKTVVFESFGKVKKA
jgi:hypothetical protein